MKAHPKGKKYQTEKHFNHKSIEFVCIGAFLLVEIAYTDKKNQNTHHDKTTTFAQNVEDSKRIIFARDTIQLNRRSFLNVFCERYSFVARNKGKGGRKRFKTILRISVAAAATQCEKPFVKCPARTH